MDKLVHWLFTSNPPVGWLGGAHLIDDDNPRVQATLAQWQCDHDSVGEKSRQCHLVGARLRDHLRTPFVQCLPDFSGDLLVLVIL